jgi:NAD dependent epimerase/dehydratase family enzyme
MGQELLLDSLNVYPHQLTALNYTFAHKNLEQLFTD